MLDVADVFEIILERGLRSPAFRVLRDGNHVRGVTFDRPGSHGGTHTGLIDVNAVIGAFDQGATIVLQSLQLYWRPLAVFCRLLEQRFRLPVQANAYLTPPGHSGLSLHHDVHDVFVLQQSGQKRWRLFDPVVPLPLKTQKWEFHLQPNGGPVLDRTLTAGERMYVPRGWPHEVVNAGDDVSLHLTIGVHARRTGDLARAALTDLATEDVALRRSYSAAAKAVSAEQLQAATHRAAIAAERNWILESLPILDASDVPLPSVSSELRLTPRATLLWMLEDQGRNAVLTIEGKQIIFPSAATPVLEWVLGQAHPFAISAIPDLLMRSSIRVIVARLMRERVLTAA
jgi:lysine-specific demethylase/histidyl-hydroxylase NO66